MLYLILSRHFSFTQTKLAPLKGKYLSFHRKRNVYHISRPVLLLRKNDVSICLRFSSVSKTAIAVTSRVATRAF